MYKTVMLCPGSFISLNVDAMAMVHFISTSQNEQFVPTPKIRDVNIHVSLKT